MKICMLTTGHRALDDRIYYKQALSLKKKFDDITIIAPDQKKDYVERGIKIIGVNEPKSLYERIKLVDKVIDKAIELNADVYHFHDFEILFKIMKIKKHLPNSKIIYDVHEHYPDMLTMSKKVPKIIKPLASYFADKMEINVAKKMSYIITADDAVKERFKDHNANVDVIYNFSEFNIQDNSNIEKVYDAIYQGGITLERGVFEVTKAIQILKEKRHDIKMIFVGPFNDSKGKELVFNYIKCNNLEENICFVGNVPHKEVEEYIRKSKVGIVTLLPLPKYFKNIPIKQFEYMSCGIPVVGSNLPPIEKFVKKYNSGIIVDPTNPHEIAAAIGDLLDNDELRKDLGRNGVTAVSNEYNWSNMENKLLKLYEQVEKM